MTRLMKWQFVVVAFLVSPLFVRVAQANTISAASCNTGDVQVAINAAAEGDAVLIPPGTCSWTSGVAISGKGIVIQGAGSGRIIAYDNGTENLTVATGTLTMTIAGYSPGFSSPSIANGETLRVFENNFETNWMQGTVTSLVGSTLTMNITSTGGSGTTHRWLVATVPQTVLIDNSTSPLFDISEDSSFHTDWSGIKVAKGTGTSGAITMRYNSSGQAILIHDCWMELFNIDMIEAKTNRGVIWNCSANGSSASDTLMATGFFVRIKIDSPQSGQLTWTQPSYWGTTDTDGQRNLYVENCDIHATQGATDNDDNGRMVWRHNLMDHAIFSTHGADSSPYGQRYFEYYNNVGNFNGYSDGTTFNMANGWIGFVRGGTFIAHDNSLPAISSPDYTKPDIEMTVYNLQLSAGPNPCWGAGTSGGADYHAPRQVGFGRVTGTGTDGSGRTNDSVTYVGDSEPIYIWNNGRTYNIGTPDYGGSACTSPDRSSNYIVSGRDYFQGTAKPGYAPYTYPHPLTLGQTSGGNSPAPPSSLTATVQ